MLSVLPLQLKLRQKGKLGANQQHSASGTPPQALLATLSDLPSQATAWGKSAKDEKWIGKNSSASLRTN
jgi:hypothetical protein